MLKMSAIQLKASLNELCKVFNKTYTFLLDDRLNLLNDGCLQYSNGTRLLW